MEIRLRSTRWFALLATVGMSTGAAAQGLPSVEQPPENPETPPAASAPSGAEAASATGEAPAETGASDDAGPAPANVAEQEASSSDGSTSPVAAQSTGATGLAADAEATTASAGPAGGVAADAKRGNQGKNAKKEKQEPWEKQPKIKVRGLLRALWMLQDVATEPTNEFRIASARLELKWRHSKLLESVVEIDGAEAADSFTASSVLRDAYVRVKPLPELGFRAGQFKKPYSRLELRARRSLRLVDRGITNAWIVEDLGYGDRDIGAQVEGRTGDDLRLSYQAGVFNGSGRNASEADLDGSKDLVFRVELEHQKWLSVGSSLSHKRFDQDVTPALPRSGTMGEADFRLKIGGLRLLGEGMFGENPLSIDHAESWSALLLASYEIPLTNTWRMALEPVAKAEILKVEHHIRDAHIWSFTAGANYHLGSYFRLMAQGEWLRPSANTLDLWAESHRLLVQAVVDLRQ